MPVNYSTEFSFVQFYKNDRNIGFAIGKVFHVERFNVESTK
jgi:hypothetical protein